MNGVALALTLATLGVDYSFRTTEEGQVEYTIQIEQEFLQSLANGEEIHSDVPPEAGAVQRICIRIGTTPVRHTAASIQQYKRLLVSAPRFASADPALVGGDVQRTIVWPGRSNPEESFGVSYGWQPDQAGKLAYYVQIDPTTLKTLAAGDEIHAAIDPAAGRVGQFVVVSGNKQLPRVSLPPDDVATVTPPPTNNRTRFQTGADAAAPTPTTLPPADRFRAGDFGAPPTPPSGGSYNAGGTLLDAPRTEYAPPAATRPPLTNYPPSEPAVADSRGFTPAPSTTTSGGRFDQYRSGTLQPPVETAPPPTYVQPVGAEQPQYQQPQYQQPAFEQPTTRYSPPSAPGDRFASAPRPAATTASLPARSEVEVPQASVTAPQAKDQWWWPYWLFVVFSLFLSIGGNLYLGWTAAEFYSRYRLAVDRLRTAGRA